MDSYQDGLEMAAKIENLANDIFTEAITCNNSILEALAEVCQTTRYDLQLVDCLMADECEVGRRVKTAVLRWLEHDSEVLARRGLNQ